MSRYPWRLIWSHIGSWSGYSCRIWANAIFLDNQWIFVWLICHRPLMKWSTKVSLRWQRRLYLVLVLLTSISTLVWVSIIGLRQFLVTIILFQLDLGFGLISFMLTWGSLTNNPMTCVSLPTILLIYLGYELAYYHTATLLMLKFISWRWGRVMLTSWILSIVEWATTKHSTVFVGGLSWIIAHRNFRRGHIGRMIRLLDTWISFTILNFILLFLRWILGSIYKTVIWWLVDCLSCTMWTNIVLWFDHSSWVTTLLVHK